MSPSDCITGAAATSRRPLFYPAGVTVRAMLISMRRMVSPLVVALVIDDEPTHRAIRRSLGRPEVIVAPLRTAERALRYLDTIAVDLLVTDFELSGLSGRPGSRRPSARRSLPDGLDHRDLP